MIILFEDLNNRSVGPVGPVAPVAPVAPVGPVAPVAPVGPVAPVAPVGPVGPVAPVGPVLPPQQYISTHLFVQQVVFSFSLFSVLSKSILITPFNSK